MRRFAIALTMVALGVAIVLALAACGGGDATTTDTIEETTTEEVPAPAPTPAPENGGGDSGDAGGKTTGVETTPGGAVVPATPDCPPGEIYSQGAGDCVTEGEGNNPCPQGEVPAADQPACLPKD